VRALAVVLVEEMIEAGLLLQDVAGGRARGRELQRQMPCRSSTACMVLTAGPRTGAHWGRSFSRIFGAPQVGYRFSSCTIRRSIVGGCRFACRRGAGSDG
jgi:hypothetical protein